MRCTIVIAALGIFKAAPAFAQGPPESGDPYAGGTKFLDHDSLIKNFPSKSFLRYNIPFIDLPDKNIQDVYHYRWSALARHLRYAVQGAGHAVTEFIQPVFWAGAFSTIDAAAGHHINEIRWFRDKSYVEDYIDMWTKGPATDTSYTNWVQYAASASANVTGHTAFRDTQLEGFVRMFHDWDHVFDPSVGLYYYNTLLDAQEFSLPGYISNEAAHNSTPDILFPGPDTFRPSVNSYLIAAAHSISALAKTVGNANVAAEFDLKASQLEQAFFTNLWSSNLSFFVDNIRQGNPGAGKLDGREGVGFYPFRFGIGLNKENALPAVQQLFDSHGGFKSEHFPTTLEMRHRFFTAQKPGDTCCFWQGQNWPFTTAHVLYSLDTLTRLGLATAGQYYELLSNYATVQHKNNIPYIAEEHYPFGPDWSSDGGNYSEHYAHSTFNDNVLTGLLGLIPRADNVLEIDPVVPNDWNYFAIENIAYHDHLITVLYDKDGSRYKAGTGLTIFVDGQRHSNTADISTKVELPSSGSSLAKPATEFVNIATNVLIAEGVGSWPRISASYANDDDGPEKAIDGLMFFDQLPTNRWTNIVSGGPARTNDTLLITLQRPRELTSISMGIYVNPDDGVACPARITITDDLGHTIGRDANFAANCIPNEVNTITFTNITSTNKIGIHFIPQNGQAVGVTEIQLWVPANQGPLYYAADALPLIANGVGHDAVPATIVFDGNSKATKNGAVMGLTPAGSVATFAGIVSSSTSTKDAVLTYRNPSTTQETLTIDVNHLHNTSVILPGTGKSYNSITLPGLELLTGKNWVSMSSSGANVRLETLSVSA